MSIYKAYTDVSIKKGRAIHSYCIFDKDDNFIKGKVFKSELKGSTQGEEYSIQTLVKDLEGEKIESLQIFTDHLGLRLQKERKIHEEIRKLRGELIWVPRCKNKLADKACKSGNEDFFERGILLSMQEKLRRIKKPNRLQIGAIRRDNVTEEDKKKMYILYRKIVQDLDKVTIDQILEWAEKNETANTRQGRRYLVKCFIMEKYKFIER